MSTTYRNETLTGTLAGLNLSGTNTGDQTISDATISTSDVTTNDVSTTKHGFAPKAPNDAALYLDGTGIYSAPQNVPGNAITATMFQTARTISISGDMTYTSPNFNGSANVTAAGTLKTVNSNVGTFAAQTVNGKGLVTAAGNLTGDVTTSGSAATLASTAVTPGSYTLSSITVDAKGRITAASSGAGGVSPITYYFRGYT